MRVLARLACCAYLVFYVIIPMLRPSDGEETMNPSLRVGIAIGFIVVVALITVFTIKEIVQSWKAGLFKADAYSDDLASDDGDPDGGADESGAREDDEDESDEDEDDDEYYDEEDDAYYYDDEDDEDEV